MNNFKCTNNVFLRKSLIIQIQNSRFKINTNNFLSNKLYINNNLHKNYHFFESDIQNINKTHSVL